MLRDPTCPARPPRPSHLRRLHFPTIAALVLASGSVVVAQRTALTTEVIATGLQRPIFVVAPPGDTGRLFIAEQRGSAGISTRGDIKILDLSTGEILPTPFLSVTSLATGSEQGLLGLAFAPDYATSGTFYVHYNATGGTTRLARYQVSTNPNVAEPSSEEIFLTTAQPFGNHNGGWIGFGPDGFLYIALGDGGSGGDPQDNAQNLNTLLGKMLRIDVSGATGYTVPPTNPFVGGGGLPEIWAYGLRNPWRSSFDRQTGDLWIADVGQNDWEEVNFQPAIGAPPYEAINYGWRCYEGNATFNLTGCPPASTMQFPVHVYPIRNQPECAVTGGYVYRGTAAHWERGTYFFSDYACGNPSKVWSFRYENGMVTDFRERTAELNVPGGPTIRSVSSFGEDANGELYIVSLFESVANPNNTGSVYKIVPKCYANCDENTTEPILTVDDFTCFINEFALAQGLTPEEQITHYANCDGSTTEPVLTVDDFTCFINAFALGCS